MRGGPRRAQARAPREAPRRRLRYVHAGSTGVGIERRQRLEIGSRAPRVMSARFSCRSSSECPALMRSSATAGSASLVGTTSARRTCSRTPRLIAQTRRRLVGAGEAQAVGRVQIHEQQRRTGGRSGRNRRVVAPAPRSRAAPSPARSARIGASSSSPIDPAGARRSPAVPGRSPPRSRTRARGGPGGPPVAPPARCARWRSTARSAGARAPHTYLPGGSDAAPRSPLQRPRACVLATGSEALELPVGPSAPTTRRDQRRAFWSQSGRLGREPLGRAGRERDQLEQPLLGQRLGVAEPDHRSVEGGRRAIGRSCSGVRRPRRRKAATSGKGRRPRALGGPCPARVGCSVDVRDRGRRDRQTGRGGRPALAVWLARQAGARGRGDDRHSKRVDRARPLRRVRSVQAADITMPARRSRGDLDPMHSSASPAPYWRFLSRVTLGLIGWTTRPPRPSSCSSRARRFSCASAHRNTRWTPGGESSPGGSSPAPWCRAAARAATATSRSTSGAGSPRRMDWHPCTSKGRGRELLPVDRDGHQPSRVPADAVLDPRDDHARVPALARAPGPGGVEGSGASPPPRRPRTSFEDVADPPHDDDVLQPAGTE